LQVREPKAESVKYCVEFAKKTGDYASLSGIDIKVIALTYELEVDNLGSDHLRKEPVISQTIASKDKPAVFQDTTKLAGWYNPTKDTESDDDWSENESGDDEADKDLKKNEDENEAVDTVKAEIEKQLGNPTKETPSIEAVKDDEPTTEELNAMLEKLKCEPETNDSTLELLVPEVKEDGAKEETELDQNELESCETDDFEDDQSWITPKNIKKVKKSLEGRVEANNVPLVACITTDYALQNVLKQINLQISALDGRVIKNLRTYILRCYACFKTTSIMTKVFCPNCGNKTLKRVAVSLDENGKQIVRYFFLLNRYSK